MVILGFLIIAIIVWKIIDVKTSDAKLTRKLKQNHIESIVNEYKSKTGNKIRFEQILEQGFENEIENALHYLAVKEFGNDSQMVGLIIFNSIGDTYNSLKEDLLNEQKYRSTMSEIEILNSLNKVRDKVKNKYFD